MRLTWSFLAKIPYLNGGQLKEIGWVAFQVLFEFIVNIFAIKLYTNLLGPEGYGVFSLAQTGIMFAAAALTMPIQTAFTRYFYTAESKNSLSDAAAIMLRWFMGASLLALLAGLILAIFFSQPLGLDSWSIVATSILFITMQWRALLVGNLVVRRRRRAAAIQTVSYLLTQVVLVGTATHLLRHLGTPATHAPAAALAGYACADLIFALIAMRPMRELLRDRSQQIPSDMRAMIWTMGLPFGALLLCQTIQGFSDRFIINAQLGLASAGLYVAAFQICGIPFSLLVAVLNNLLTPIAYQRAKDINDPKQLWAADKILLAGIAAYLLIGAFGIGSYMIVGQQLLHLLTSEDFAVPALVLVCLAASRYVQSAASLLQIFFAIHHKMSAALSYRIGGSLVTIPLTWWALRHFRLEDSGSSLLGAAIAGLSIGTGYIALLCVGPSGCYWIIRANRLKIKR